MRLIVLGSCSGTEPVPGRRHVSFTIEKDGAVYWFDAGEGCSYTAHLMGVDLLSVKAIFITHTHMDHIGGLPNLLWNIRKIDKMTKDPSRRMSGKRVQIFMPYVPTWHGIIQLLAGTEGEFKLDYELAVSRYQDGEIFNDGALRVLALHNTHIGVPDDGEDWRSYSLRIEAENKSVVYSGDVSGVQELQPILDSCDLLLMETGHHQVEDICNYLKENQAGVKQLVFIHHGRAILADPDGEAQKGHDILGLRPIIAEDGMIIEM